MQYCATPGSWCVCPSTDSSCTGGCGIKYCSDNSTTGDGCSSAGRDCCAAESLQWCPTSASVWVSHTRTLHFALIQTFKITFFSEMTLNSMRNLKILQTATGNLANVLMTTFFAKCSKANSCSFLQLWHAWWKRVIPLWPQGTVWPIVAVIMVPTMSVPTLETNLEMDLVLPSGRLSVTLLLSSHVKVFKKLSEMNWLLFNMNWNKKLRNA